jgi:hypothetical protein
MPFSRCPNCDARTHINIGQRDPVDWYREQYPDLRAGDEVPELCADCSRIENGIEISEEELAHQQQVRNPDRPSITRDTVPCPHCGKPLRTAKARQCFECGVDWH